MDRLLCGDVGYGKTEVAMRAAFKAVLDGKRRAVLAPRRSWRTSLPTFQRRFAFPRRSTVFALALAPGRSGDREGRGTGSTS
jgi:hypothetical protein